MTLLTPEQRPIAVAIAQLFHHNPFRDARQGLERAALGGEFVAPDSGDVGSGGVGGGGVDSVHPSDGVEHNQRSLERVTAALAQSMRKKLKDGVRLPREDRPLYAEVCLVALYDAYADRLDTLHDNASDKVEFYDAFCADYAAWFFDERVAPKEDVSHTFALFFQLRRAFFHIYRFLLGASAPAAKLRADIWDSIFTHDIERYRRALYSRLGDVSTLVTGASGTGKELVARAVGLSRYVPFHTRTRSFRFSSERAFLPLNLSALTPTLVESELFGHKKGAFTGANEDREGWLAACPAFGAVFLDEIGEIEPALQVKLLRVLESRSFSPMGSTEIIPFRGKIIAATNRAFGPMLRDGSFREDLFFRLCSNRIETPTLSQRAQDDDTEIPRLVRFFAEQLTGSGEADAVAAEVLRALGTLPKHYAWPGNIRELSQAVRQVVISGSYAPWTTTPAPSQGWAEQAQRGALTLSELSDAYIAHVYQREGTYECAARLLGIDRRTVKARAAAASASVPPLGANKDAPS